MDDENRVQVATCSVAELFSATLSADAECAPKGLLCSEQNIIVGRLTIPEYQRPYRWKAHQLNNLLSDIRAHRERTPHLPYYLGSLILHQSEEYLNIIDGQQRITTLALLALVLDEYSLQAGALKIEHPISQINVRKNLAWFKDKGAVWLRDIISFDQLQFSLVVTQSEDDAYRFFETQNTGGVRLSGPDIIKAHHLRAVDSTYLADYARKWEALGDLNMSVLAILKGRYWQRVRWRELPRHNQKNHLRDTVVHELATQTGHGEDFAFTRIQRTVSPSGAFSMSGAQQGYDMRQPLNAGINTIHFIEYFQSLYQRYWLAPESVHVDGYGEFTVWLKTLKGCGYLQSLYESCLLLYISQFGEAQLEIAAKKLFRVVYSRRVSNQKAVRENSVPSFVEKYPVLDWIAMSFTPEQCFSYFDAFELTVDPSNLKENNIKRRYMDSVNEFFGLALADDVYEYETQFALALSRKIGAAV